MAALNGKETRQSLLSKGFVEGPGDHHFFEFWHEGTFITRTRTSRNDQLIHDGLISAMSKQCKVSSSFFKEFARCTKSKDDYVAELKRNSVITQPPPEEAKKKDTSETKGKKKK
ncbi:MAG: hypothetical protein JNK14_21515 [Chitinophagaceae bacterium]|nr:hypothetical protein [Chitinophagaceae bacterium]